MPLSQRPQQRWGLETYFFFFLGLTAASLGGWALAFFCFFAAMGYSLIKCCHDGPNEGVFVLGFQGVEQLGRGHCFGMKVILQLFKLGFQLFTLL